MGSGSGISIVVVLQNWTVDEVRSRCESKANAKYAWYRMATDNSKMTIALRFKDVVRISCLVVGASFVGYLSFLGISLCY